MDKHRLYELVLNSKTQIEVHRDEINKYYTSLFAALLTFTPVFDKLSSSFDFISKSYDIKYTLFVVSLLGIVLSISWRLALERIHTSLQGTDKLLIKMEMDLNISFMSYMGHYFDKVHAPKRVTKQQMLVPSTFIAIFSCIFLYVIICFGLQRN
jgi:hypothetical protein